MKKGSFKKAIALLLTCLMMLSVFPLSAFAEDGAHAAVQSIAVKNNDGTTNAASVAVGTSYKVVVSVQNTGTYEIMPSIGLYEVRSGHPDISIDQVKPTGTLATGSNAVSLSFDWAPTVTGSCALKAVVTASVDSVQTTLATYTAPAVTITAPDGTIPYDGTQKGPGSYTISSSVQLQQLSNAVAAGTQYSGTTFTLTKDVSLGDVCGPNIGGSDTPWKPIGTFGKSFSGTFDGGEHKISDLYINATTEYQGLFGFLSGSGSTIKNLAVSGSVTTNNSTAGGIVGYSSGTITNCLSDVDMTATGADSSYVGGLGGMAYGTMKNCVNTGRVTVSNATGTYFGAILGAGSTPTACYTTTSVSPGSSAYSGVNGTLTPADGLKTGKTLWSLNTADGSQTYSNVWTADAQGLRFGSGDIYYRLRFMNITPSVKLAFTQNGQQVQTYPDGFYTDIYVTAAPVTVAPTPAADYTFASGSGLTQNGDVYTLTPSADRDFICGAKADMDARSGQIGKIGWYTANPSASSYTLSSADDLIGLQMLVAGTVPGYAANSFSGVSFSLSQDIDLSAACSPDKGNWTPIGTADKPFAGSFNGGGHTVGNLYINSSNDNQGLFGYAKSPISNVAVSGSVSGGNNVGAVVGNTASSVLYCLSLASVSGSSNVGGVAGSVTLSMSSCLYYKAGAGIGVAGSAGSANGCYYLSDTAVPGAFGTAASAAQFASREMAYWADTPSGSHVKKWQPGGSYPVLGSNTVYKLSLTNAIPQTGKSVAIHFDTNPVCTSGDTQYIYLLRGESVSLDVTNSDQNVAPAFSPASAVTTDNGTNKIVMPSADTTVTYRFAQSVTTDTNWYDAHKDVFTLTTEAQLRGLASLVNDSKVNFTGKTIFLGADINIVGGDWPMIGNRTNPFFGTFDGQGHKVSGFYVKMTGLDTNIINYQGFFGWVGSQSTIKNLHLDGTVSGRSFCGILAGYIDSYCTVTNCTTNGTVMITDNSAGNGFYAAGITGDLDQYGIMTDCVNNATVTVNFPKLTGNSSGFGVAGLVAFLDPHGTVTSCTNNGALTCTVGSSGGASPMVGGIVGIGNKISSIKDCTNNGAIVCSGIGTGTTSQTSVGGIAGSCYTDAAYDPAANQYVISNCRNNSPISLSLYNTSSVAYAGGITGGAYGPYTGMSTSYNLSIDSCVNVGNVSATCPGAADRVFVGGIAGGSGTLLADISRCGNMGSVTLTCTSGATVTGANSAVGGIIGSAFNLNTSYAAVWGCTNNGAVSGPVAGAGGIAGATVSGLALTDCYNTAAVTGTDSVGGVIGLNGGTIQSVFNYGGNVTATAGTNAGFVAGSGMAAGNTKSAYYLSTTTLTGVQTASDAALATSKTADEFKGNDQVYALNTSDSSVEDRGVWKQGTEYPELASAVQSPVYQVTVKSAGNGTVTRSKQYLSKGDAYTVTFTPESGYILNSFSVTDITNGKDYRVEFNGLTGGTYSVALRDADGKAYPASFKDNVLTCVMDAHSLAFTGDFAPTVTGTATVKLKGNGGWFDGDENKSGVTMTGIPYGTRLTLDKLDQPEEYRLFSGWYTDPAGTTPYNFSTAVSSDITLYAKWDANSFVVTYEKNGGSWTAKDNQTVIGGACIAEPTEKPVRDSFTFTGWYSDTACLYPFNFQNTKITANITLYAGWIPSNKCQVIFDLNGGTFSDSTTRKQLTFTTGTTIGTALDSLSPANGTLKLRGWYSAPNGGSKWANDKALAGDLVLYAHWDKADGTPTFYNGTEDTPMEIEDAAMLCALRDAVNTGTSFDGYYFKLSDNITLPSGWQPIGALKAGAANEGLGANIYPFSGTFDGGNKTVTVPDGGLPLFGYVREATIKNLNIFGKQIAGYGLINNYTVDYGSDGDYNKGTGGSFTPGCPDTVVLDNVTLKAGSSTLLSGFIGGFASGGNTVIIENSTVESGVVIGYDKAQDYIGSFAGWMNGIILNCTSGATVYGANYVGGMLGGKGQSMGPSEVNGCVFSGAIVASGIYAGGMIGSGYYKQDAPNSPCVSVQNCCVTGSITASDYLGGIFGGEPVVTQCWSNGIGYIRNNCFTGTLTAKTPNAVVGGIIGYMNSLDRYNIIENNYYLSDRAASGIGKIYAIDYTTPSYSRSETFVPGNVCIPVTAADLASGKIAAQLNAGNNSTDNWMQSGGYPALGTAATATHKVSLSITGSGTASLTGDVNSGAIIYQNAGGQVTVNVTPDTGFELGSVKVLYSDGTSAGVTGSKSFAMPQQDITVSVVFAPEGTKYVTGIAVAAMPTKTSYKLGDSFDVTGLTIKVTYSDGTTETIPATADMISGFSSTSSGVKTLTVTYMGSVVNFSVTVAAKELSNISVTFSLLGDTVHGGGGTAHTLRYGGLVTWITPTTVQVPEGSCVGDVFSKVLDANGYTYVGLNRNYISSITTPGGIALAEFTNGSNSGWMYTLNGTHPLYGLNEQKVANGDVIVWHYTDDYTKEEGSDKWNNTDSSSGGSSADTTLTPTATVQNGTASVSMTLTDLKDAVVAAKTSGSPIVVKPTISGTANSVKVVLDKDAVSAVAVQTSGDLTVKTPVGTLTLPNAALDAISAQASGAVTVSLGTVDTKTLTANQQKAVGNNTIYDISVFNGNSRITNFNGSSLTISLPYTLKSGEDASGVTVWYMNDSGNLQQMTATYDKTTGLATFTTTHLSYYLVGYTTPWTNPFSDVKSTDWFYDAVKYASQKSLMSGTSSTAFGPSTNMTRAMLVTVLYRMEGKPAVTGTNSFTDVKSGEWYADAVTWANTNKIVSGYASGLFGTNDSVTREQLAAIMMNYAKYKKYDVTKTTPLTSYTDAASVDTWAADAVRWAVGTGLISGTTGTTLVPSGTATRAQVATILMRFDSSIG